MEDQDPTMVISKLTRTKSVSQSQEVSPAAVEDHNGADVNGVEEPEENYETDTAGSCAPVIKATSSTSTGVTAETQQEQHMKKKKRKKKEEEEEEKGFESRRFRLELSADEILSDLIKMNSTVKRVKKRSRKMQDRLDNLFPGGCLSRMSEKSYDTFSDRTYRDFKPRQRRKF